MTPWIPDQPRTREEMDTRFLAWDAVGVRRERQNELARAYTFEERPAGLGIPRLSWNMHGRNETSLFRMTTPQVSL